MWDFAKKNNPKLGDTTPRDFVGGCKTMHSYHSKLFASVNVASGNICVEHGMPMGESQR